MKNKFAFTFVSALLFSLFFCDFSISQGNFNIEPVSSLYRQYYGGYDLEIEGDYVYIAASISGLLVLDISDPERPRTKYNNDDPIASAKGVALTENHIFVCNRDTVRTIMAFDRRDMDNIQLIGELSYDRRCYEDIFANHARAYTKDNRSDMHIIDVSQPDSMWDIRIIEGMVPLCLRDSILIAYYNEELQIIDVSDDQNFLTISSIEIERRRTAEIVDDNLFVIHNERPQLFSIFDITDMEHPELISSVEISTRINDFTIEGDYVYLTNGSVGIEIIDVSDLENPAHCGEVAIPECRPWFIDAQNGIGCVTDGSGFSIIDISDPIDVNYLSRIPERLGRIDHISKHNDYIITNMRNLVLVVDASDARNLEEVNQFWVDDGLTSIRIIDGLGICFMRENLAIYEMNDPENPELYGQFHFDKNISSLAIETEFLELIAISFYDEIRLFNSNNLQELVEIGRLENEDFRIGRLEFSGDYLFAVDRESLLVFDVWDPENIRVISSLFVGNGINDMIVSEDHVFLTIELFGEDRVCVFVIIDVGDIDQMRIASATDIPYGNDVCKMSLVGDSLYIAGRIDNGLIVYDVSNIEQPELAARYDTRGYCHEVVSDGGYMYVADGSNLGVYEFIDDDQKTPGVEYCYPQELSIKSIYPNPFNSMIYISFRMAASSYVEIYIYDLRGRMVDRISRKHYQAGDHLISWDSKGLSSGQYMIDIFSNGKFATKPVAFIK